LLLASHCELVDQPQSTAAWFINHHVISFIREKRSHNKQVVGSEWRDL